MASAFSDSDSDSDDEFIDLLFEDLQNPDDPLGSINPWAAKQTPEDYINHLKRKYKWLISKTTRLKAIGSSSPKQIFKLNKFEEEKNELRKLYGNQLKNEIELEDDAQRYSLPSSSSLSSASSLSSSSSLKSQTRRQKRRRSSSRSSSKNSSRSSNRSSSRSSSKSSSKKSSRSSRGSSGKKTHKHRRLRRKPNSI
jgi:hypothetical protein